MKYAVSQGVAINQPGRRFVQGDRIADGDLPAALISQLLEAGSIVKDDPEPESVVRLIEKRHGK